jgi:hypothetical protein
LPNIQQGSTRRLLRPNDCREPTNESEGDFIHVPYRSIARATEEQK